MKVLCVLSDHRAHKSKSPLMHNGVIRARRLEAEYMYVPFQIDPENAGAAVNALRALNIAGANVTVPCKEKVIPFLDHLSPEAQAVGAVNTIVPEEDGLCGYNTDIGGFLDALEYGNFDLKGKSALLCGTGGAARGLLQALKQGKSKEIFVAGRSPSKTAAIADEFGATDLDINSLQETAADLIINATAITAPEESHELATVIHNLQAPNCSMVVDINYGRKKNMWLELSQRSDAGFMDGLPMLAMQACRSFQLWTGLDVTGGEFIRALTI